MADMAVYLTLSVDVRDRMASVLTDEDKMMVARDELEDFIEYGADGHVISRPQNFVTTG